MRREPVIRGETRIDLRPIPPPRRHALVLGLFGTLRTGEALVMVDDHDPQPLHRRLLAEHAGTLEWECLDQGAGAWHVRIIRVAAPARGGEGR